MNVGIVCYASVGGSGIVATELGKALATRGHQVHVISSEPPFRLVDDQPGLVFHRVHTPSYPLFREPQYLLSLATTIVHVCRRFRLDVIHAHYAIPHATAAFLAKEILASGRGAGAASAPKVITTLHGTDITIVGSDASYAESVAFSIERSDGVTAVSESLKRDTYRELGVRGDIRVIPNFLDCDRHRRVFSAELRQRLCPHGRCAGLFVHVSNFRPVKRIDAVLEIFRRVRERVPARLLLIGEGPELGMADAMSRELGLAGDVELLGEQDQLLPLLSVADVFLLPSLQESFGLAAMEAMACEMPVVASRVGGLPEVIDDGITGFLRPVDDLEGMAERALLLLTDEDRRRRMGAAARRVVQERFCTERVVPMYEECYREVLS